MISTTTLLHERIVDNIASLCLIGLERVPTLSSTDLKTSREPRVYHTVINSPRRLLVDCCAFLLLVLEERKSFRCYLYSTFIHSKSVQTRQDEQRCGLQ
jgi:hypothetical protein